MSDETYFRDPQATRTAAGDMITAGAAIEAAIKKYGPLIEDLNNVQTYGNDEPGKAFADGGGDGNPGYRESVTTYITDAPSAGEGVRVTGEAVQATVDTAVEVDRLRKQAIDKTVKRT